MDAPEVPADRITRARPELLLSAILLAALLLRVIPWLANLPLHHDEALYGTWARAIADGSDPFLLIPWVDKPPLVLYLLGLSIRLFGASELSLRVPGMVAGVLTAWATFGLGRRVAGERGGWIAALLVTLSPFAILFAPTAFTDGWLTLFIVAAAWAALAGRPGLAGVLLGLACASKQQGVMGVPLVVGLVVAGSLEYGGVGSRRREGDEAREAQRTRSAGRAFAALGLAALGFAVVFGAVTYWDSLRWHNRPSYWDQSLLTYGGVMLAGLDEWPTRAAEWARQAGYWFGAWPVTVLVLGAAAVGGAGRPRISLRRNESGMPPETRRNSLIRGRLLAIYVLGYLLVHAGFTFQPWDRYLLPVLPLVCVLCGLGLVAGWERLCRTASASGRRWVLGAAAGALVYAATLGVTMAVPVGSDIGAYWGVAEAAEFLAEQPAGSTVYYDRIGWHLGYYLYGQQITRSWYDSPVKLASEAARVEAEGGKAAQWLALPEWEEARLAGLQDALAARGFVAQAEYAVTDPEGKVDLTLYRLEPRRAMAASGLGKGEAAP